MYFMLGMPQKSLTTELETSLGEKRLSVSKQAFSKARYKISPHAFEDFFICQQIYFNLQTVRRHGSDTAYLPLTVRKLPLTATKTARLSGFQLIVLWSGKYRQQIANECISFHDCSDSNEFLFHR